MYTNLPAPFKDWTVDEDGTIHTASGYRCTPQILEAAMWLMESGKYIAGSKRMFSADEICTAKKRTLYEISDIRIPPDKPIRVQRPLLTLTAALQGTTGTHLPGETVGRKD